MTQPLLQSPLSAILSQKSADAFSCGKPVPKFLSLIHIFVWRLFDNQGGSVWTNLLLSKLLPLALLVSLLLCAHQARRGIAYYRHFFLLGGVLLLFFVLAILFSLAGDGSLWSYLCSLWQNTRMLRSFFYLARLVNHLLLLLFFLLAVYDFVQSVVRRNSELQLLTVQNHYASEHAAYLRRSPAVSYTHLDVYKRQV